jgi:hypothetical protein
VVGAAGVTVGEVWPVVVRGVELLVAGGELLSAVRLWPHGPNSINAPAITTAAIIAVIVPVPIPVLRLSRPVRSLGVRLLNPARSSRPGWLSRLLILVLQKLNGKNLSKIKSFQRKRRAQEGNTRGRGFLLTDIAPAEHLTANDSCMLLVHAAVLNKAAEGALTRRRRRCAT